MKIYISNSHDPYLNQEIEHTLVSQQKDKEDILFLWLNKNAIIIGRNQNIFNEINEDFVKEQGIKISRRYSGGGAVYHDLGNILFSIIGDKVNRLSYEEFLDPIVGFLQSIGVNAKFEGRNDVLVDGMKISGNAQFIIKDRIAHHGTLLFDADLSVLNKSLLSNKHQVETKGIKSQRQRVTNIKEHIEKEMSSEEFLKALANYFVAYKEASICPIPEEVFSTAKERTKFVSQYEWIYGKSPQAQINNKVKYPGGNIGVSLDVQDGVISDIHISGDFLSKKNIEDIYPKLLGVNYTKSSIKETLKDINTEDYFGTITLTELVEVISGE